VARAVSVKFVAVDKYSHVGERIRRKTDQIRQSIGRLNGKLKQNAIDWSKASRSMKNFGMKFSIVSAAMGGFITAAVVASGKNEALRTSFDVMTGSAELGGKTLQDLYTFAAKTPFEIVDLGDAAKMLLAMDTPANELIDTLNTLGNMAAATGRPIREFALVWGQIMQNEFLTGGDALQLTNKGIGIRGMIAKKLGLSVPATIDLISKRQIPAWFVKDVLTELVSEGGRFYQMMDKTSRTLPGIWSNTKDLFSQFLIQVGDVLVDILDLKGKIQGLNDVLENTVLKVKAFAFANPRLAKFLAYLALIVVALGPIILGIGALIGGLVAIGASAAGIAATLGVFAAFAAISALVISQWERFGPYFTMFWDGLKEKVRRTYEFIKPLIIFSKKGLEMLGVIDTNFMSQTNINVQLSGPKGSVDNMSTESTGPVSVDTGLNMAGSQ